MKKQIVVFSFALLVFTSSILGQQQIHLTILDVPNSLPDIATIEFNPGTSTIYVPPAQDIVKILNTDTAFPQIYSLTSDGIGCYSNGYGSFNAATMIALGYRVAGGSTYYISTISSGFDPTSIIRLEDRALGIFHDLRQDPYYFQASQFEQSENRFFLHISYPPSVTTTVAGCSNDDGMITINQEPSIAWTWCYLWHGGQKIDSFSNINGIFDFSGLSEGSYIVEFKFGIFLSAQQNITVDGHQINASIYSSTLNGVTGQAMNFSAIANNAEDYTWTFGDSSEITGVANPDYTFYEPSTYTITVVCTNRYGCSSTATITVVIEQGTSVPDVSQNGMRVFAQSKNINIYFSSQPDASSSMELYNLEGEKLLTNLLVSSNTSIDLQHLSTGVYIAAIKSRENIFSRKIILTD